MADTPAPPDNGRVVGESLFRDGPFAILILDAAYRIQQLNPVAEGVLGYAEDELAGAPFASLLVALDGSPTAADHPFALPAPDADMACNRLRRRQGDTFPAEVSLHPLGDDASGRMYAVVRGIAAQAAREQELIQQRNLYQALSESNQLLVRIPEPEQVFDEVCRIVVEHGGMALAWVGLVEEAGEVEAVARFGPAADYVDDIHVTTRAAEPEGQGPTGTAIRENRHVLNTRIQQDPSMAPWQEPAAERGLRSSGAFPIVRGDKVVGALNVYADDPDFFAEPQVNLLDELAADMGAALTHFDRQEENRRLREIIEASPDYIGMADEEGRVIYANPATKEALGQDELEGRSIHQFHPPDSVRRIVEEGLPTARQEGLWQGEVQVYHSDGEAVPYSQVIVAHRGHRGRVRFFSTIARNIADLKAAQERIRELAYRSEVTGLLNRTGLRERLGQEAARLRREGRQGAVIHADLDGFKAVNDSLGTAAGDNLLNKLGEHLCQRLRAGDVVAHIGGDELVVLTLDLVDDEAGAALAAESVAEKVRAALAEPITCQGRSLRLSASIGVTLFPGETPDADQRLQEADIAVDHAKEAGGDTVRFYQTTMMAAVRHQLDLEQELHDALERGELHMVYQPLWDLATEQPAGLEALVRWTHPERGLVSPGEFIPLAERTGLIVPLGRWILEQVLAQVAAWLEAGLAPLSLGVAVNVSARQFAQPDWVAEVQQRLANARMTAECLKLEVTESLLMANPDTAAAKMRELRSAGVRFALDDFGTGYSSLAYLQDLPLDYLKVDRSFVQRIGESGAGEGIIEAVLAMAGHLDLGVIAEGVETAEQAAFLRERGGDVGQGFYWSRPLPPAEVTALLPRS